MLMKGVQQKITYLEKPVSQDEKKIGAVLQAIAESCSEEKIHDLDRLYDDNAVFDVFPGQRPPMNKTEFINDLASRMKYVRRVVYTRVLISVKNPREAICHCTRVIYTKKDYAPELMTGYLKFINKDGNWRVSEAITYPE